MRTKSVIFDFDYTLVDSSRGAIECIGYAFAKMGLPIPRAEAIRETIGLSLPETFSSLTGDNRETHLAEFSRLFVQRADQVMLDNMVLLDSVKPALNDLIANGVDLGIVSTKYRYRIEAFLQREKLRGTFGVIIGGEDISQHKPDPAGLIAAMRKLKRVPLEVIYVGDSLVDAETAERACTPFVAVLSGVTSKDAFAMYRPHAIINDLSSLTGTLFG